MRGRANPAFVASKRAARVLPAGSRLKHGAPGADRTGVAGQHGGFALSKRPTRLFIGLELLALGAAAVLAAFTGPGANWDLALLGTLLAFSILSDVGAVETRAGAKISGSFLALILAMVYLGGTPAAVIGVITIFCVVPGTTSCFWPISGIQSEWITSADSISNSTARSSGITSSYERTSPPS